MLCSTPSVSPASISISRPLRTAARDLERHFRPRQVPGAGLTQLADGARRGPRLPLPAAERARPLRGLRYRSGRSAIAALPLAFAAPWTRPSRVRGARRSLVVLSAYEISGRNRLGNTSRAPQSAAVSPAGAGSVRTASAEATLRFQAAY